MKSESHLTAALLALALLGPLACSPAEEEADAGPAEVTVEVGRVIRATLRAHVTAYGSVTPAPAAGGEPAGAAYLATSVTGLVLAVPVSEGQTVRAGDLVVRLEDRIARAEVDRAQTEVRFAEKVLAREQTLLDQENTSQKQFEQARQALALARADLIAAQGALAQVQLRSPLDGVVSRISVLPGQSVDLSTVVAEIVDLRRLVVSANVSAGDAMRVQTGQTAEVSTAQGETVKVAARVSFVRPSVDPETGTVLVRLAPEPGSGLRPGQFVSVRIAVEEHAQCLAVPRASVYVAADGSGTLSVVEGDTAYQKEVRVGFQDGDLIEVEGADLAEGMTVVTVGSYALPDEARVRRQEDGAR